MKITLALVIMFMSFSAYRCKQIEKKNSKSSEIDKDTFVFPIVKVKKNKFYVYYYEEKTNQVYLRVLDPSGNTISKDKKLSLSLKEIQQIGYEASLDQDEKINISWPKHRFFEVNKINKHFYLVEGDDKILRFDDKCSKIFSFDDLDVYRYHFMNQENVLIVYDNENRRIMMIDYRVGMFYYNRKTKSCQHQLLGYVLMHGRVPSISDPLYYDGFFHVAWYSSKKKGIVITLWNPKSNERRDIFFKRPFAYQQFSIGRMANSLLIAWHESKRGKSKSSIHTRLIKLD